MLSVNAAGSEARTNEDMKKKWSDIKMGIKQRTAVYRRSVAKQEEEEGRGDSPHLRRGCHPSLGCLPFLG